VVGRPRAFGRSVPVPVSHRGCRSRTCGSLRASNGTGRRGPARRTLALEQLDNAPGRKMSAFLVRRSHFHGGNDFAISLKLIRRLRRGIGHRHHRHVEGGPVHLPRTAAQSSTRAAANPARVRSAIRSRSNSASATKIPKNSRPFAVVVSIWAPAPASTLRPILRARRSSTVATRCLRSRPSRSSFQTTRVTGLKRLQAGDQAGTIVASAGGQILIDSIRSHVEGRHRVALGCERLAAVTLRHPHVADEHVKDRKKKSQPW